MTLSRRFAYVYAHGWLSDQLCVKGQHLAKVLHEQFGIQLHLLNLNGGDDKLMLTFETAFAAIDEFYHSLEIHNNDSPTKLRFIGCSFGGQVAASYSAKYPSRVDTLLLLCPAVNIGESVKQKILPNHPANSETRTVLQVPFLAEPLPVPCAFVESCYALPAYPLYSCNAVIIHGKPDNVVLLKEVEKFLEKCPEQAQKTELILVDDDHSLLKQETTQVIEHAMQKLFKLARIG